MGDEACKRVVLVRFSGDISTKARGTRYRFLRRLLQNLRDALASDGVDANIRLSHDRIFVEIPEHAPVDAITRVFGVQSVSPVVRRVGTDLDEIVRAGVEVFRGRVRGRRFAVRARRVGNRNRIPASAREVERELGAALLPDADGVDLDHPEVVAHLELLETETCFFPDRIPAHGGLPLGVEGRGVALLSGGFDSAVAAWSMLRRGVSLDYVFCNLGGATHEQGVLRVAKVLADRWSYGERPRLYAVDFEPLARELERCAPPRYWQVLLKRQMLRAASRIASDCRASAIVTGDSLGQVSSQTLRNLSVIADASPHLILRPLIGANKEEIIGLSERIGTFELSKVVGEYCAMAPRKPATAATRSAVRSGEAQLDPALLERQVRSRRSVDLRGFDPDSLELPDLEVESIPPGATVIDLRSAAEWRSWHAPDALRLDFGRALAAYPSFERGASYVLYCEFGLKSAHLAELMRRDGFDAHHFRGGVPALRRALRGKA